MKQSDRIGSPILDETLKSLVSLGRRVTIQMAIENYWSFTAVPGWSMASLEQATKVSLAQMQAAFHAMQLGRDVDPHDERWRDVWTAMEVGYRETMAGLLKASGRRGGGALQ